MQTIKSILLSPIIIMPFFLLMLAMRGDLDDGFFVFPLAYLIGLLGVCLVGLPVHFLFRYIGIKTPIAYVFVGFFTTAGIVWAYNLSTTNNGSVSEIFYQGTFIGIFGAACAFSFRWLMYRKPSEKDGDY